MGSKFYLTTAIDYANGEPHIGHAFEKIGADCIARYRRLRGDRVHFLIGMDEHGQKVAQAAENADTDPQAWVDAIADQFLQAWDELAISNSDFIRTTEGRHHRTVTALLSRIQAAGHIYEGVYKGYYCVGCEAFKLHKDLVDGHCPEHPTLEVRWVEEPNYFFRFSSFGPDLLKLYDENPDFLRPPSKMNEIRNIVESGLQDLSVSRARLPWGIGWPHAPDHTIYVWFDAVINYLSATGFPENGYDGVWPADLHVIGPDIVRFHAALWPAMLMAAGLAVPRGVWSHGWVNLSGARFSKTAGVKVTLREAIDRHGPDALRYFLLREVPWDGDGTFTWERFDARYTADLADGYGNLASRVLAMIHKYTGGRNPESGSATALDTSGDDAIAAYRDVMDDNLLHEGAAKAWGLVASANRFIEDSAPWSLAKSGDSDRLNATLGALSRALTRVTLMATPFIPNRTQTVWEALGGDGAVTNVTWRQLESPSLAGAAVRKLTPLFPKARTAA